MGGDHAPRAIVTGAVQAVREGRARVRLVGPAAVVRDELSRHDDAAKLDIPIEDAADAIGMDESPVAALRRKPRASVKVAAEAVKAGRAQAFFSAGHTGATLMAAHATFGMLPGVARPALAVTMPTRTGIAILLDVGATLDCRPEHLVQFGRMGAAYARAGRGLKDPKVGLLSIGEEAGKGNDLIRDAHAGLKASPLNFIGNLEARDLFSGQADVIVCDGFTGNIALKVGEGLVETLEAMLREELFGGAVTRVGAWLSRRAFRTFRKRVDYREFGGAPLLGVAGLAIVAHGRSPARAVCSGIAMAARLAEEDMVNRLSKEL